jgi:DNA-binding NarL/FixJ family response regulator
MPYITVGRENMLLADGLNTAEVAGRLNYSERTIKNVLHDVVTWIV